MTSEQDPGMTTHRQVAATELRLQCLTFDERPAVLPAVMDAIDRAGGWMLEKRTIAAHALEMRIEIQLRALLDFYAALVGSGVELTREAHLALTEKCVCRQHQRCTEGMASILTIRLEVTFLADMTIESSWTQWVSRKSAMA